MLRSPSKEVSLEGEIWQEETFNGMNEPVNEVRVYTGLECSTQFKTEVPTSNTEYNPDKLKKPKQNPKCVD
jgi:hypothetical protein